MVFEFKTSLTTHDVLTYSTKARRHKQIYPYLRYGLLVSTETSVPRRFFIHTWKVQCRYGTGGRILAVLQRKLSTNMMSLLLWSICA